MALMGRDARPVHSNSIITSSGALCRLQAKASMTATDRRTDGHRNSLNPPPIILSVEGRPVAIATAAKKDGKMVPVFDDVSFVTIKQSLTLIAGV